LTEARNSAHVVKYTWRSTVNEGVSPADHCRIVVIGVGGAGSNTVTRMMEIGVEGVECIAINTDAARLDESKAHQKILIGEKLTRGLGVGGDPKLGRAAMEESKATVEQLLAGVDIAFITAGLGGGTGTGASPVVAKIARRKGAVTVGVVTTPFRIERNRRKAAAFALAEMRGQCDTVAVIDNNKLTHLTPQLPMTEAFRTADQVLAKMIQGIVETISVPSLINLDMAGFRTVVKKGGMAAVGVGESAASNRAEEAVRNALTSPLLNMGYAGATGALVHVTGDSQMTIEEANRVGETVAEMMDNNATVIWGARVNSEQQGKLRVTLIMTGVNSHNTLKGLGTIAPQLFNMEPGANPEKPLNADIGLYQMEKC